MLIDDQFRKCVSFLFADIPDRQTGTENRTPVGTAFFVAVPLGDIGGVVYAVTARHVVYATRPFGPLYVRINTIDGGFEDYPTPQDSWICHASTDVAVSHVRLLVEGHDIRWIALEGLATDDYVIDRKVGAGDEVFFVGLFSEHPGRERNLPIVRFGNISLMPFEKIPLRLDPGSDTRTPVDAYLVEARSWGGQSGSPAFIYFPLDRKLGDLDIDVPQPRVALLGLVQGHYEIEQDVAFLGDVLGSGRVPVNAGIAAVVPAQKIIEVLMQEELVELRKEILERARKQIPPTPEQGEAVD